MYVDRLPPHNVEAEESVIGSGLIDGDALQGMMLLLEPEHFYGSKNRLCYEAMIQVVNAGQGINQVTVGQQLSSMGVLEEIGGSAYLSHLVMVTPTSIHIEYYAQIVEQLAVLRSLIDVGGRIADIGYHHDQGDVEGALEGAEDLLYKVRGQRRVSRDFTHIRQVLDTYVESSASLVAGDVVEPAVATGFTELDALLGNGLQRSDMMVVAARPSLGKSTLAFNIARGAAGTGARVGIFSLEMSEEQVGMRLLAAEASVEGHRLRLGLVSETEETRLLDAVGVLSDLPIYIDDTPLQSVVSIRSKARRLHAAFGIDLLVIDYLQLIGGTARTENRVQEMSEISRTVKGIARDLNVPIIACSQLSRAIEQRQNHRPLLSDLRESGSIEQDADVVAFIHREDVYISRDDWEKRNPTEPYPENIAEIIFAKHRNGPVGAVPLYFRKDFVRFEGLEEVVEARWLAGSIGN